MRSFTERQERVTRFIQRSWCRRGRAPSYRAIAAHLGVDVRSAFQHVSALERKGVLERVDGRIELIGDYRPEVGLPVLGRVAAGAPTLAVENVDQYVNLAGMLDNDGLFVLRVKGDSMRDAGILDGDLVLAREQSRVEDGEIAVVLLGEEATVKRLRLGGGRIRLEPANRRYKPIEVDDPSELRIAGKVLMAVRTF
jgi:repressor LexA